MLNKKVDLLALLFGVALLYSQTAYGDGVFITIPGLEVETDPGIITITNANHQSIPLSWLAIKFTLPAKSPPIEEVSGNPDLNWTNTHPESVQTSEYVFQNRAPFPGGKVAPRQKIILEFFKKPNPEDIAEKIEIFELNTIYEEKTPLELPVSFYGFPIDFSP
jgi:hypothetical protein